MSGAFFPAATLKAGIIAKTQNPDAYNATLVTASLGLSYELTDKDTVSASGEVSWERDDDAFGTTYRKPGLLARLVVAIFKVIPKFGPFKPLAFEPLTP